MSRGRRSVSDRDEGDQSSRQRTTSHERRHSTDGNRDEVDGQSARRTLQRRRGNQAIQQLVADGAIQPKLEVGDPDDEYEREADRVADEVVAEREPSDRQPGDRVGKASHRGRNRSVRRTATDAMDASADAATGQNRASLPLGGGQPLPDPVRSFFEPRMGRDFGDVRIHTDDRADEAARSIDAEAFAHGRDVAFRSGAYRPETESGKRLLAHELTHVVQQTRSPVQGTNGESDGFSPGANGIQRQEVEGEEIARRDEFPWEGRIATGWSAALRETPEKRAGSPHRNTLADLPRGTPVTVVGRDGGWLHVETTVDGEPQSGYVSRELVTYVQANQERERPERQQEGTETDPETETQGDGEPEASSERDSMESLLPGYSQKGDTCGAASLVSALMIWDRQQRRDDQPADLVASAIDKVLVFLMRKRDELIEAWDENEDLDEIGYDGETMYDEAMEVLPAIRDRALEPDATITEGEYQYIGLALYFLYADGDRRGLGKNDIDNIQKVVGLDGGRSSPGGSLDEIFEDPVLTGLQAGGIAQVAWYVRTSEPDESGQVSLGNHVFLVGRFDDGQWFLSDQGQTDPLELVAPSLRELRTELERASRDGRTSIHTRPLSGPVLGGWTGVIRLDDPASVRESSLISEGTYLAEVDAGLTTIGDRIESGSFVSKHYTRGDAHSAASSLSGHGALIAEMPRGVFNVYETNLVRDANVSVNDIDSAEGGLLTSRTFVGAELMLNSGETSSVIRVY